MPDLPITTENRVIDKTQVEINQINVEIELRRVVKDMPTLLPFTEDERTYYRVEYRIKKEGNLLGDATGHKDFPESKVDDHEAVADKMVERIRKKLETQTRKEKQVREEMNNNKPLIENIAEKLRR